MYKQLVTTERLSRIMQFCLTVLEPRSEMYALFPEGVRCFPKRMTIDASYRL